jgi:hypothetical protein
MVILTGHREEVEMKESKLGFKSFIESTKGRMAQVGAGSLINTVSFFIPSIFLLALGLIAFFNPALLGIIVASMFIFFGALFACLTWRVLQWKKRVEGVFKQFGGQFVVQAYGMPKEDDVIRPRRSADDKKIIIH